MAQQRPSSYFSPPNVPDLQDPAATDILRDHGARVSAFAAASQRDANALFRGLQNLCSGVCDFRLTLTSATPVTDVDVLSSSTLYFSPYKGNRIGLYNGANWNLHNSAEMSLSNAGLSINTVYDIFCYDKTGVPTLEALAWTNDTTRATALALQDGVLAKTGAVTRRYVGTVRVNSVGVFVDRSAFRWNWNYYNRVRRPMIVTDAAASWNYTTATIRQANANAANQLDFVIGVSEDMVSAETSVQVSNSTGGVAVTNGIGLDSTVGYTTGLGQAQNRTLGGAGAFSIITSSVKLYPGIGRHVLTWLESSAATGTTTWVGSVANGIHGEIWG